LATVESTGLDDAGLAEADVPGDGDVLGLADGLGDELACALPAAPSLVAPAAWPVPEDGVGLADGLELGDGLADEFGDAVPVADGVGVAVGLVKLFATSST